MIVAVLHTRSFEFHAAGASKDEAKERVTNAFVKHLQQYGSSMQQWREETDAEYHTDYRHSVLSFRECLEDWYGINTLDFGPDNTAVLRDGSTL